MSATLTACDTKTTENKDETIVEQVVSQADTQTTDVLSALSMPKISSDNIDSQNSVIDTSYQNMLSHQRVLLFSSDRGQFQYNHHLLGLEMNSRMESIHRILQILHCIESLGHIHDNFPSSH